MMQEVEKAVSGAIGTTEDKQNMTKDVSIVHYNIVYDTIVVLE